MIPLREQELLRQRFQRELTSRVRLDYFTQKPSPIYVPGREECALCAEGQALLEEVASLSERVALSVRDLVEESAIAADLGVDKLPATVIRGQNNRALRFFGLPSGGQFPVFIDAFVDASRGSVDLRPETVRQLRKLRSEVRLQVLVAPNCTYSPALARTALRFGLQHARIKVDVIEVGEFPALVRRYGVRAVPTTVIDDRVVVPGSMDESLLLRNVLRAAEGRPISPTDLKTGPATALASPEKSQPQTRPTTGSGLLLP